MNDTCWLHIMIPEWVFGIVYTALAVSLLLSGLRLIWGPDLPNRIVALDLAAAIVLCFAAVHAMDTGQTHFLDVALAIAVIVFISTIAFARHMEKGDPVAKAESQPGESP